ncbi:hypothetical protein AVEN_65801-1, partial [Araneus ventricosus]
MPLTKEFQNHHRRKYDFQRRKIKFKRKLDVINESEEHGNDPSLHNLPSPGEIETDVKIVDNTVAAESSNEMSSEHPENSCK